MKLLAVATILFIVDSIWLSLVGGPQFGKMVEIIQGKPMKLNIFGALFSYILLITGVYWFCVKDREKADFQTFLNGALFGLIVYGVFDATNLAIFKDYSWSVGLTDTLWGTFLCGLTSYLSLYIVEKLKF